VRVAVYARVSTLNGHQDPETQLIALRDYCKQREWTVAHEYVDKGVSGAKDSRPALNQLMTDAKRRRFDVCLVWKLDRFGRSTRHLVNALAEFNALGIAFVSMTDSLDTTTPQGRLMFAIISAMAEFERELIRERVKAGLRRARAKGHKPGFERQALDLGAIRERNDAGETIRQIAKSLGISAALIYRRFAEVKAKTTT
jgi:DNA invertase Pin-like site-specific DNA recombinase